MPYSKTAVDLLIAYFNAREELNKGKLVTSLEELRGQPEGLKLIAYMQAYIEALANYRGQKVAMPVGAKEPGLMDHHGNINSGVRPQDDFIAVANALVANKYLKDSEVRANEAVNVEAIQSQGAGVQVNDMDVVRWAREAGSQVVLASGTITSGIKEEADQLFGIVAIGESALVRDRRNAADE